MKTKIKWICVALSFCVCIFLICVYLIHTLEPTEKIPEKPYNVESSDVESASSDDVATKKSEEEEYFKTDGSVNACDNKEYCEHSIEAARKTLEERFEQETNDGKLLSYEIKDCTIDKEKTIRRIASISGSELAISKGWTTQHLEKYFLIVKTSYYVEYDGTKSPNNSGDTEEYMHMSYNEKDACWERVDAEFWYL